MSDGPADDVKGSPLLPGAGAKQEQRLFRALPELLSTAADGSVMCRVFSTAPTPPSSHPKSHSRQPLIQLPDGLRVLPRLHAATGNTQFLHQPG